jgi:type 1 glutamine amidotransferase
MTPSSNRRQFIRNLAMSSAAFALPSPLPAAAKKSVLLFTKSSAWIHDVIKDVDGKPSIVETAVRALGSKHGFSVTATKDGRIFESDDLYNFGALLFFTSGDLTRKSNDGNWPMSELGKKALLESVQNGTGFVGVHSAADTFHTLPDPPNRSNRYIAHGEQSDPYLRMVGGELIRHADDPDPHYQTTKLTVNDPKFPGFEGLAPQIDFTEEWYSMKDYAPDLHVLLTLETRPLIGNCYKRAPYPITWARQQGQGRVFYSAMGDRVETWKNLFFLNLLAGGIRWALRDVNAAIPVNLTAAAPGYAQIPPKSSYD